MHIWERLTVQPHCSLGVKRRLKLGCQKVIANEKLSENVHAFVANLALAYSRAWAVHSLQKKHLSLWSARLEGNSVLLFYGQWGKEWNKKENYLPWVAMGALYRRAWIHISCTFLVHTWAFCALKFTPTLSSLTCEEFSKQDIFLTFVTFTKLRILNKLYNIEQETSSKSKLKIWFFFLFFFSLHHSSCSQITLALLSHRKLTQNKLSYVNCNFPFWLTAIYKDGLIPEEIRQRLCHNY